MNSRFICPNEQYLSRSPQAGTGREENADPISHLKLLIANNQVLKLMAGMQEKLSGEYYYI
jgi:hypothetical protein